MTHGRGRTNKARNKQRGGMKFDHEIYKYFIDNGIIYNDLNVMHILIANTTGIQIVWDASTYSFIFELTIPGRLIDPYGLPIGQSVATHAAFTAVAAGAPELGTRVSTFCAKISFVDDVYSSKRMYKHVKKVTVSSAKANKEADTQRRLFEEFACLSTTAPFVPDVLAHAILTGDQFNAMFAKLLSPPATTSMFATALSTFTSTKKQGVLGTPNEIYKWIMDWCALEKTLMIDVIFMEMMDFGRTAPSAPRSTPFQMIYKLRSHQGEHQLAALRMMANIASVRGKGIMPHDFHEGNGMATDDGLQLYLIDWGGIWNLAIPDDRAKVLHDFKRVCDRARTTSAEEQAYAMTKITASSTENQKRVARFPSIEDLCVFFQLNILPTRDENVTELKNMFKEDLDNVVDFTCVTPTPKEVHHALMMVAFVDFMSNRMNFDDYPYCQCGSVLKIVYPAQLKPIKTSTGVTVTAFDDFRTFLKTFAAVDFPSNTRLPEVVELIKENVKLCSSVCSAITVDKLRATSWIDEATKAEAIRRAKEAKDAKEEARKSVAETRKVVAESKAESKAARRLADEARKSKEEEAKARLAEEARLADEARRAKEAAEAKARLAEEARKSKEEEAKARLAEEARLADEARRAKEAAEAKARLAEEARKSKAAAETKPVSKVAAAAAETKAAAKLRTKTEASRERLIKLSTDSGIAKSSSKPESKRAQALDAAHLQSAVAQSVAVPTSLLARFNPMSWFKKKKGGTRKQCKQRKQRRCFTKRRYN